MLHHRDSGRAPRYRTVTFGLACAALLALPSASPARADEAPAEPTPQSNPSPPAPTTAGEEQPETELNSVAMVIVGSSLLVAGATALVFGIWYANFAYSPSDSQKTCVRYEGTGCAQWDEKEFYNSGAQEGAVGVLVLSGIVLAVGTGLTIVGARQVPVDEYGAITIEPLVGLTGGGVRVRF